MGLEDATQTALLALKENWEGEMKGEEVEMGICTKDGFRIVSGEQVKEYLGNVMV